MSSTRKSFTVVVDKSGYAVRAPSGDYVADAIESRVDALAIADALDSGQTLNLYYEGPEGGGNEQHADPFDAIDAFESLVSAYPDVYARLHPLDQHDLVMHEHTPTRYRNA